MALDVSELLEEIKNTATTIINKDVTTVRGFSNRQLNGIANQAALIATGIKSGQITEATRSFFLEQLVELSQNFANTLVGLTLASVEKLWNGIVSILWGFISKFTGINLGSFKPL